MIVNIMNNNQNLNQDQAKEFEAKVKNYAGPEGITTRELEAGLWFVEHKQLLRKILYGFLILTGAISWSYTIYGFAYYLARGMSEDEILTKQLVAAGSVGHDYISQISARELAIRPVEIIKSADNKYDLYVQIVNNNQRWWAEFDYYFIAAGKQTEKISGFILPTEAKYFLALAQNFANPPTQASLVIDNLRWRRLNAHQIPDWNDYFKKHLDIISADIKFTPAGQSLLSDKLNLNQLSFNALNRTAYNFWETGFTILLYRGGDLANLNHYILYDFMSGQKRSVDLSWPGDIGWVDKVEIIPEINIMRDDIYIKYEGGIGQEK